MELNNITNTGTWGEQVTRLNDNFNKVALGIDTLQSAYQSLSQSAIEVVDTLPQTGEANKIYRLVGTTSYTDYMYNADDLTTPIPMATYNNAIDNTPTANSANLVTSGGVAEELALGAVYDVSAKNPTAGPNNDGKWGSLSALLSDASLNTLIPVSVRKGGMSVKFVQSSDNKYVHFDYMGISVANADFSNLANWKMDGTENVVLQSASSVEIHPNVFNVWGEVASLVISFAAGISGYVNEYMFQFTCPSSAATTLTLPDTIRWANDDELEPEAGYTYQVSVIDNLAVYAGWEAQSNA